MQYWFDQSWIDTLLDQNHIYVIEMKKNHTNWFFFNLAEELNKQVTWTPKIRQAHFFLSEEAVEEFKAEFISPRKTSIVRMSSMSLIPY